MKSEFNNNVDLGTCCFVCGYDFECDITEVFHEICPGCTTHISYQYMPENDPRDFAAAKSIRYYYLYIYNDPVACVEEYLMEKYKNWDLKKAVNEIKDNLPDFLTDDIIDYDKLDFSNLSECKICRYKIKNNMEKCPCCGIDFYKFYPEEAKYALSYYRYIWIIDKNAEWQDKLYKKPKSFNKIKMLEHINEIEMLNEPNKEYPYIEDKIKEIKSLYKLKKIKF